MRRPFLLSLSVCAVAVTLGAQAPALDSATIARLRDEATVRSQVYEHVWWLSEVFGPRVTGTPAFAKASEWAMQKFRDWGLANVHQERWAFGQGWTIDGFSATMLTPQPAVLIGAPRNYSPSTPGVVTGDVVQVRIGSPGDFTKYAGALRGKIVLMQPVRPVRMLEGPVILRMDEGNWWTEAANVPQIQPPRPPTPEERAEAETRQALAAATRAFLVREEAAVLLERGADDDLSAGGSDLSWETQRVDGGTIFPGSGGSRDPKVPVQVPSATLAVEHYNRLARLLERGQAVRMTVNIQTTFHPEGTEGNGINTIAEIPGTDLAHEVVIMGAHMDGVPYATGATDNATGTAAMMEAVRAIQALEAPAAPHDPHRALGRRGAGAARIARLRGAALLGRGDQVAQTRPRQRRGLFQPRQRHRPHPRDLGPGQRSRVAGLRAVGRAAQGPRLADGQPAPRRRHRSFVVRRGRPARLPVHPGTAGVQLALAPFEHGHLRSRAEGRSRAARRGRRGIRVVGRQFAGTAAAAGSGEVDPMNLRDTYPPPLERAVLKSQTALDAHMKAFIAVSPFLCLATSSAAGADVTPRGDRPGFVHVPDDHTLLVPDWPGNNRLDSLGNVLENDAVGLLFFVPGVLETLRVNGRAEISMDEALLARWDVGGKRPRSVLR